MMRYYNMWANLVFSGSTEGKIIFFVSLLLVGWVLMRVEDRCRR
jgi:hypothetical protein